MSNLIIGFGIQGQKREKHISKKEKTFIFDPHISNKRIINNLAEIKLDLIENVYICTPDQLKPEYISKFVSLKKNILVEKPLILSNYEFKKINKNIKAKLYTAYNHRFEPHISKTKLLLKKNIIGKIYHVEVHYGNGTIQLWKDSWRAKDKFSILHDLGSHVIDMLLYLLGNKNFYFKKGVHKKNELNCYDYFNFYSNDDPSISCTLSTINWKNHFILNIIGEKGSINMEGLCKWGPSTLKINKRVFPSGIPKQSKFILNQKDPTWMREENFFKKKIDLNFNTINNDVKIMKLLEQIKHEN